MNPGEHSLVPLDISLARKKVEGDEHIVVNLFCINPTNGKTICLEDATFDNYFYVLVDTHDKAVAQQLAELSADNYAVKSVEPVSMFYFKPNVHAYKVIVNHIHGTKRLSEEVWKQLELQTLHVDIPYLRKYVLDHKIEFLKETQITIGEQDTETKNLIETFALGKIGDAGESFPFSKLSVLALDIETYATTKRIDTQKNPILMVGLHTGNHRKVMTWGDYRSKLNYVETYADEKDMLDALFSYIRKTKPHIITGYNSDSFDFAYIKDRCDKLGIKPEIPLDGGELRFTSGNQQHALINGMPHLDLFHFIRTNLRQQLKTTSYSLSNVSKELVGNDKKDVDISKLFEAWDDTDIAQLDVFAEYNAHDSHLCVQILEKIFANITEFSDMIHIPIQELTRMAYSQLVESYLMTRATEYKVLVPPRPSNSEANERLAQPKNVGAFVFKPTPGFYEHVIVFDFRSLYPSLIASLNIDRASMQKGKNYVAKHQVPEFEEKVGFDPKAESFIPKVIADIIKRRDELKVEAKNATETQKQMIAARIYNLKILANSMYGYLSFARARWYCYECGGATTAYARHFIKKTIAESTKAGFNVIYGDTDSVFLELKQKSVKEALDFVADFNTRLPGIVELQFEDNFETGVFVGAKSGEGGAKKRYALYDEDTDKFKIAGLEYVRTDWSDIARETQYEVLTRVLKQKDSAAALSYVRDVISKMREGKIDIEKYILSSRLSRELDQYENNLPHVVLARKMRARGEQIHSRSVISYIVTQGKGPIFERVVEPKDAKNIDIDYYISNQVIPSVISILSLFGYAIDDITGSSVQGSLGEFM